MKLTVIFFSIVFTFMGATLLIAYILPEPNVNLLRQQAQYTCEVQGGRWLQDPVGQNRHCVRIGG